MTAEEPQIRRRRTRMQVSPRTAAAAVLPGALAVAAAAVRLGGDRPSALRRDKGNSALQGSHGRRRRREAGARVGGRCCRAGAAVGGALPRRGAEVRVARPRLRAASVGSSSGGTRSRHPRRGFPRIRSSRAAPSPSASSRTGRGRSSATRPAAAGDASASRRRSPAARRRRGTGPEATPSAGWTRRRWGALSMLGPDLWPSVRGSGAVVSMSGVVTADVQTVEVELADGSTRSVPVLRGAFLYLSEPPPVRAIVHGADGVVLAAERLR
jgi:hypothetical protein